METHTLIPALRRQRQVDLCEFKTSLVYRTSVKIATVTQKYPVFKNRKKKSKETPGTSVPGIICSQLIFHLCLKSWLN